MHNDKDFDTWNDVKKRLESSDTSEMLLPREREVWMCFLGKNLGFEQNGGQGDFSRPVLIVKKFNTKMFWVVPLSSKQKDYDFYFNFTDPASQKVSLILAQLRLVSIKRFSRVLYELPTCDFESVCSRLVGFIQSKPRTGRGFSAPSETEGTLHQ